MFFGIVKMYREVDILENDEFLIKNKFNCLDIINMILDIDLDMLYVDLFVFNKSNGMVIKGEVYLIE